MKQHQIEFVKQQILENGYISRNKCLRNHITRLGAIINILINSHGYVFVNYSKSDDYNYWGRKENVGYGKNDFVYTFIKINNKNK